jgi:hypothetical protein
LFVLILAITEDPSPITTLTEDPSPITGVTL